MARPQHARRIPRGDVHRPQHRSRDLKSVTYPDFYRLARDLQSGNADLGPKDSQEIDEDFGKQTITSAALEDSNVITSRIGGGATHRVAIDLDMDAALLPTSTPGHHHLFIDKELPWEDYKTLLGALKSVGLIQEGYYKASVARECTVLRTPWTKKDKT